MWQIPVCNLVHCTQKPLLFSLFPLSPSSSLGQLWLLACPQIVFMYFPRPYSQPRSNKLSEMLKRFSALSSPLTVIIIIMASSVDCLMSRPSQFLLEYTITHAVESTCSLIRYTSPKIIVLWCLQRCPSISAIRQGLCVCVCHANISRDDRWPCW